MDCTLNRPQPLIRHPLRPAQVAVVIAHRLACLLADVWTRRPISRRSAPDLPEAVGASDAELLAMAGRYRRDPAEAIWAAQSAATQLSRWWT